MQLQITWRLQRKAELRIQLAEHGSQHGLHLGCRCTHLRTQITQALKR